MLSIFLLSLIYIVIQKQTIIIKPMKIKQNVSKSTSLQPTNFPINLPKLQTNTSSSKSTYGQSLISEIKQFNSTNPIISPVQPDLFQYNDRSPLFFSDDEECEEQILPNTQIQYKKQHHLQFVPKKWEANPRQNVGNMSNYKENDEQIKCNCEKMKTKLIQEQQNKPSSINSKQCDSEQIKLGKQYQIKPKSPAGKIKIKQNQQTVKKIENSTLSSKKQTTNQEKANQTARKLLKQQQFIIVIDHSNKKNSEEKDQQISQPQSKTQAMLKTIQIDKKHQNIRIENFQIKSQREEPNQQNIPNQQVQTKQKPTPTRKRRHKIFDTNSIKDPSERASRTPNKNTNHSRLMQESIIYKIDKTPQIKALDVLDKLVNQLDNSYANDKAKIYKNKNIKEQNTTFYCQLAEFNTTLQILISNLNRIAEVKCLLQSKFQQKIANTKQLNQLWKEKLNNEMMSSRLNAIESSQEQETRTKYGQLSHIFQNLDLAIQNYLLTKKRLSILQLKLKNVMIFQKQGQLRKLYILLNDVMKEIQKLRQLKAGCGTQRLQKMMEEYFSLEINLLMEVHQDLKDNFADETQKQNYY